MVYPHIQFHDFTALLLRKCSDTIFNFSSHFICKDPEPIFGDPDNVILAVPYCLC